MLQDPSFFYNNPDRLWDHCKFGMNEQDVFTVLAPQFNSTTMALLDNDAFCRNVAYLSNIARDRDELFSLLQE